jgi:predicted transcriptional regulator
VPVQRADGLPVDVMRWSFDRRCTMDAEVGVRAARSWQHGFMSDDGRLLHGEIQTQVMKAIWRIGGGTVEEIRAAMPAGYESAYTTVQTQLNRLAARGLLSRTHGEAPRGPTAKIVYAPRVSEEAYLADSIERTLAGASSEARRQVLVHLLGHFGDDGPAKSSKRERKRRK